MADIALTSTTLTTYQGEKAITVIDSTSTVINATETFAITPNRAANKLVVIINVGPTHGAVAFSVAAGTHFGAGNDYTGSVAQDTSEAFVLDTAKFLNADGKIIITATPATGKKLYTDHAMSASLISLPF